VARNRATSGRYRGAGGVVRVVGPSWCRPGWGDGCWRREAAERRARVRLFPDEAGTASLVVSVVPTIPLCRRKAHSGSYR